MSYECQCGKFKRTFVNASLLQKLCPKCNTKLELRQSISKQVKIDQFIEIKDSETMETRRNKVLQFFNGVDDATDSEIMKGLGFTDRNKVSPRRNELVQMDLVEASCKRECKVMGNNVTAWCVK